MKFKVNVNKKQYNTIKEAIRVTEAFTSPEEYIRLGMLELNKDVMELMEEVDTLNSDNYLPLVADRYRFNYTNRDMQIIVEIPTENIPKLHAIQLFLFDEEILLSEVLEFVFSYAYTVYYKYSEPNILDQKDDFINELLNDTEEEHYIEEEEGEE